MDKHNDGGGVELVGIFADVASAIHHITATIISFPSP